jgi:hypothetical protein
VGGAVDALHHGQTGRMNAGVLLGGLLLLLTLSILLVQALLLLLACTLLHLELGALLAVAGTLVVQFLVLGMDALPTDFAVATTTGTSNSLVSNTTRIHGESECCSLPELNVDLAALLPLGIGEDRVVVLLQTRLHTIEAVELDEASSHELVGTLVCAQADLGRLDLLKVFRDRLLGGSVGQVA